MCYVTPICVSPCSCNRKRPTSSLIRDDNCGTVYVKKEASHHSPVSPNDGRKELQHAVFGRPMGNDGTTERGFNRIFEDLVKIALLMEQSAYNMYINSDRVDQSPVQADDHPHHELSNPILQHLLVLMEKILGVQI